MDTINSNDNGLTSLLQDALTTLSSLSQRNEVYLFPVKQEDCWGAELQGGSGGLWLPCNTQKAWETPSRVLCGEDWAVLRWGQHPAHV